MPKQLDLLSGCPVSRSTDPLSSHAAEAEINASGSRARQQQGVLALVCEFPGRTSLELSRECHGDFDRYQIARRLADLENCNLVRKGEARKCIVGDRLASTWYPVTFSEA